MILVVGGMAAGKRSYVIETLGFAPAQMADGALDEKPVLFNLQDLVAQNPDTAQALLPALLQKQVVVCNEVGSGVIPDTLEKRRWREATGRLCNALAQSARRVVRIVAGCPMVIKE